MAATYILTVLSLHYATEAYVCYHSSSSLPSLTHTAYQWHQLPISGIAWHQRMMSYTSLCTCRETNKPRTHLYKHWASTGSHTPQDPFNLLQKCWLCCPAGQTEKWLQLLNANVRITFEHSLKLLLTLCSFSRWLNKYAFSFLIPANEYNNMWHLKITTCVHLEARYIICVCNTVDG